MKFFGTVAVCVAVIVIWMLVTGLRRRARRALLAEFAAKHGLALLPDGPGGCLTGRFIGGPPVAGTRLLRSLAEFQPFGMGNSLEADLIVEGLRGECFYSIFDLRCTVHTGQVAATSRYGIVVARVPFDFPRVTIRPEGVADRLGSSMGLPELSFESVRFNERYHVGSRDSKFAYDLIHPKTIEFLMGLEGRHWQLGGEFIVLYKDGRYQPAELEAVMNDIDGFVSLIPDYVRQDRVKGR